MKTPARCVSCGSTVMPYRRYFLHTKPTAACDGCGRRVRHRGYWALLVLAIVILGLFFTGMYVLSSPVAQGVAGAVLAVVAFGLDRWSWTAFPWDPVVPEGE